MGVGECAGEVVSFTEFGLADSEREVFEAQLHLEKDETREAAARAYSAMLQAARALIRLQHPDVGDDPDGVVTEFRARFHDTQLFHDPFAGGKFAQYLFKTHAAAERGADREQAHQAIEEAQLFIEAAHACYDRMQSST
jgi:sulfite reductase (ferredoxin)